MKQLKIAVAIAALLSAVGAQAESLAKTDQTMLKQLAQANIAEIEAGRIALDKSQNTEVKAFAQQMIDDHSNGLREVMNVAQSKGVVLPTEPDAKHKAMGKKLKRLSGDAFDREYAAQAGISDHKAAHAFVQKVQSDAKDADVKALAAKLEPTIAKHLGHVETLSASLDGVSPRTAGTAGTPATSATAGRNDASSGTQSTAGRVDATVPANTTGASGTQGNMGAGQNASPDASASGKTPAKLPKSKADKTSGNTDHPENPANKDVHPPLKQ
jgi:putative membrane protein